MTKSSMWVAAVLCAAAGILTFVTAASIGRREPAEVTVLPLVAKEPPPITEDWLTNYELTERSGRQFRSQDLDGKVHVVSFFFARCPTACRLQNGRVQELAEEFGDAGVVFVSITCDPSNDTPVALQDYAKLFNADPQQWLFLTSTDINYIRRVGAEVYFLSVEKQSHSERLLVVDRWGKIRGGFHWNRPEEIRNMRRLLKELLAETEPPPAGAAGGAVPVGEEADGATDDLEDDETAVDESTSVGQSR